MIGVGNNPYFNNYYMDLNSKKYLEKPLVTKQGILDYIQDIDVYRKYMDGKEVELRGGLHSPLRADPNPSFGFFIGNQYDFPWVFQSFLIFFSYLSTDIPALAVIITAT